MARYLVTGGAGFIGSAIVEELVQRGESVRVIDNLSSGKRVNLEALLDKVELIVADIGGGEAMKRACQEVDFVIHLAALTSVPRSVSDPEATHRVNATGTLGVLMAARDAKVRRLVYAASSSAYGETKTLPKVESMPAAPISPYGVAKYAGELYCQVFSKVYGLETAALRYFNIFGPRQDPYSPYSAVLSRFITAVLKDEPPVVYGDGNQSRDFTYVANAVDATLRAAAAPGSMAGEVFNVGTGARHSLNKTLGLLAGISGKKIDTKYEGPRPGDIRDSQADISKARRGLGYEPIVDFEKGLRLTYDWYRTNLESLGS